MHHLTNFIVNLLLISCNNSQSVRFLFGNYYSTKTQNANRPMNKDLGFEILF